MDAITLLTRDHRRVERLFGRVRNERTADRKRDAQIEVTREISAHSEAEEQVLYPAVRKFLPDGNRLADEALKEHHNVKESLAALDAVDPTAADYDERVRVVSLDVRNHVKEEESELFPQLRKWMGKER